jgi:hypothetical protein
MTKTFTQTDAIRYVYGELTKTEESDFEDAMMLNSSLRNEVKELRQLQDDLDLAVVRPSQKVIDNILGYTKSFNLHPK